MYIRKKSVAAFYKILLSATALGVWWYLLLQYGWSAWRLFSTWVLGITAIYFIISSVVLALKPERESGVVPAPMFEGLILMAFLLMDGMAVASVVGGFALPELPIWVVILTVILLPLLVLCDWLFFTKKGGWRAIDPCYWLALPVAYVATMIFTAELLPDEAMPLWRYPLPMLNYWEFGLFEMLGWCWLVLIIMLAVGYVLFLIDFAWSGKLAKKIVLPHIRTVVVDETGAEKIIEPTKTKTVVNTTRPRSVKKPQPAAKPTLRKPSVKGEKVKVLTATVKKAAGSKSKDSELSKARNHRETVETTKTKPADSKSKSQANAKVQTQAAKPKEIKVSKK